MCPEDCNSKVDEVAKSFRENEGPGKNRPKQGLHLVCREVMRASKDKGVTQNPYGNVSYGAEKKYHGNLKILAENGKDRFRGISLVHSLGCPQPCVWTVSAAGKYCGFRLFAHGTRQVDIPTEQMFVESD